MERGRRGCAKDLGHASACVAELARRSAALARPSPGAAACSRLRMARRETGLRSLTSEEAAGFGVARSGLARPVRSATRDRRRLHGTPDRSEVVTTAPVADGGRIWRISADSGSRVRVAMIASR
ncbi:putative leucine-rich repeat extensin-like protein 7 [Iris pallida]|uniref:Leucine-rich repeat extensin-like protein 7 n=1 Tax=Iris pallida TaxID=29817 RepID=A0AAX6HMY2_IRIPA|nr:putative leucine-rich repeat extensin-like protein 7 [Iris pallida]